MIRLAVVYRRERESQSEGSIRCKNPIFVVSAYFEQLQIQNPEFGIHWTLVPIVQIFPFLLAQTHMNIDGRGEGGRWGKDEEVRHLNFLDYADGESRMVNTISASFLLPRRVFYPGFYPGDHRVQMVNGKMLINKTHNSMSSNERKVLARTSTNQNSGRIYRIWTGRGGGELVI